jgi:FMN reductase
MAFSDTPLFRPQSDARPFILGLGGTTRAGSTSERLLRAALERAHALGCRTELVAGPDLPMEPYDPTRAERSANAERMIGLIRQADGVIIASPGYHGSISGLIKNALDFIEDTRTDDRVYLDGLAMGCIVVADGPQALGSTVAALRSIAHALRAWPTPYAAMVNASGKPFGADGKELDPAVAESLSLVSEQVVAFARMRRAGAQAEIALA